MPVNNLTDVDVTHWDRPHADSTVERKARELEKELLLSGLDRETAARCIQDKRAALEPKLSEYRNLSGHRELLLFMRASKRARERLLG
jgi:hypothetical protein